MGERTVLVGLVGRGIAASRSPRMHETEGRAHGLEVTYELFDFDVMGLRNTDLQGFLKSACARGFAGVNVTHPFKMDVVPWLDELSAEAQTLRAVNTVVFTNRGMIGYNTDLSGFLSGFRAGLRDADLSSVLVLGAGGAGSAVAQGLAQLGAHRLLLYDRAGSSADALQGRLNQRFPELSVRVLRNVDQLPAGCTGIVNATPVGMCEYPGTPVDPRLLSRALWVAEVVYFPLQTELLRAARSRGCRRSSV